MGYSGTPKRDDGRVHIDPIERGRPREDNPAYQSRPNGKPPKKKPGVGINPPKKKPDAWTMPVPKPPKGRGPGKTPITIQPVPKKIARKSGRSR